jgi:hypothetical protein
MQPIVYLALQECSDSSNLVQNPGFEDKRLFPWFKSNPNCSARHHSNYVYAGKAVAKSSNIPEPSSCCGARDRVDHID